MNKVKNQHFVPQCYLRNFTYDADDKYVWCRDLSTDREFSPNIENIAQQKYFYDFPDGYDLPKDQIVETTFSKFEDEYATYLKKLIGNVKSGFILSGSGQARVITDNIKQKFSFYASMQYFRTPIQRQGIKELMIGVVNKTLPHFLRNYAPPPPPGVNIDDIYAEYDEKFGPIHHAEFMFKDDNMEKFARLFFDKVWVVGYCVSNSFLYTSDNPVVKHTQFTSSIMGHGLGSPNVEIYFPISSKIVLMMFEKGLYKSHIKKELIENSIYELPEEYIRYINSMQVYQAQRQVYCEQQEFDLVNEMVKNNPEIKNKNRPQITVD